MMTKRLLFLVLLLGGLCAAQSNLPNIYGRWVTLGPSTTCGNGSACPATDPYTLLPSGGLIDWVKPTSDGTLSAIFAYSGGVADIDRNQLVIWGGGHADYSGNEIYTLDLNANPPAMVRRNNPTTPSTRCGQASDATCAAANDPVEALPATYVSPNYYNSCVGSSCAPNSRHTVNSLAYIAHRGEMLAFSGALADKNGNKSTGMWSINLPSVYAGTTSWNRLDLTAVNRTAWSDSSYQYPKMTYDSRNRKVWAIPGTASYGLVSYNPDTNTFTDSGASSNGIDAEMAFVFNPDDGNIWMAGGAYTEIYHGAYQQGIGYWNLSATPPTFNWINHGSSNYGVPTGCDQSLANSRSPGMAFDPIWHVFWIWQEADASGVVTPSNTDKMFLFNPSTHPVAINAMGVGTIPGRQCANISSTVGTGPSIAIGNGSDSGVYGRFQYFPLLDVFAACHGFQNCAIIRPNRAVENSVTVYSTSGTQSNIPVVIPRVFKESEIAKYPQPLVNGSTVATWQTDCKNRFSSDQSAKFCIVSLVIPSLTTGGSKVTFINSTNRDSGLAVDTATGTLSNATIYSSYNFEAKIHLDNGSGITRDVSARTMLNAGAVEQNWLTGPVVTAKIISDGATRAYDQNVDGASGNPLHPKIEAWCYPSLGRCEYGVTMENTWISNTQANSARDQTYAFTVCIGNTNCAGGSPTLAVNQASYTHIGFSRWHYNLWDGAQPAYRLDHNGAYLVSTKAFPNWDARRDHTNAVAHWIDLFANQTPAANWNINGNDKYGDSVTQRIGRIQLSIENPNGSEFIGAETSWHSLWVLTSDPTIAYWSQKQDDLMGYWGVHFREYDPSPGTGHYFDNANSVSPQNRVVSVNARRTFSTYDQGRAKSSSACSPSGTYDVDWPVLGTITAGNWRDDLDWDPGGATHGPEIAHTPYLLTGKNYYMEETQFLASNYLAHWKGCYGNTYVTWRQGEMGLLVHGDPRGDAWAMRTIARAAAFSPDGSPEQAYFTDKLINNIVFREATIANASNQVGGVAVPSYAGHAAAFTYGLGGSSGYTNSDHPNPPPLTFATATYTDMGGGGGYADQGVQLCARALSIFQESYWVTGLGVARDLGFNTGTLLKAAAYRPFNFLFNPAVGTNAHFQAFNNQVFATQSGYSYCRQSCVPGTDCATSGCATTDHAQYSDHIVVGWLTSWSDVFNHITTPVQTSWQSNTADQGETDYTLSGMAEMAALANSDVGTVDGYTGQQAYWVARRELPDVVHLSDYSPKWDITPRTTAATLIPSCTLYGNLPQGAVGIPYTGSITASNCSSSTFTITSGSLCLGMLLNSSTGAITQTPTTAQTCSFTVAYDTASQAFSITVVPSYTLTVSKAGSGSGTVTSSSTPAGYPADINCGSTCSSLYPLNTNVGLTATPAAGSHFVGYSVGCTGSSCAVTMAANTGVTATFDADTLTVSSVAVAPSSPSIVAGNTQDFTCTATMSDASEVDCTATASWSSSNTAVAGITGGTPGRASGVSAGGPITITATYQSVSGTASLTVTAAPTQTPTSVSGSVAIGGSAVIH